MAFHPGGWVFSILGQKCFEYIVLNEHNFFKVHLPSFLSTSIPDGLTDYSMGRTARSLLSGLLAKDTGYQNLGKSMLSLLSNIREICQRHFFWKTEYYLVNKIIIKGQGMFISALPFSWRHLIFILSPFLHFLVMHYILSWFSRRKICLKFLTAASLASLFLMLLLSHGGRFDSLLTCDWLNF